MKKLYLLTAAVSAIAMNANAADWSMGNDYYRPYIGADYVYSHADHGKRARNAKKLAS